MQWARPNVRNMVSPFFSQRSWGTFAKRKRRCEEFKWKSKLGQEQGEFRSYEGIIRSMLAQDFFPHFSPPGLDEARASEMIAGATAAGSAIGVGPFHPLMFSITNRQSRPIPVLLLKPRGC